MTDPKRLRLSVILTALIVGAPMLFGAGCSGAADGSTADGAIDPNADMARGNAPGPAVDLAGDDLTGVDLTGFSTPSDMSTSTAACTNLVPAVPATTGPTVHVSPTGSDGNDGSSAAKAFLTLGKALHAAQPGTRVLLGNGTYSPTAQIAISGVNGTAAQPVVITPEAGATPVFDFSSASGVANSSAITFNGCTYVFVDGITVANAPATGFSFNGGSFMTLTRSTVHDVQDYAIQIIGHDFTIAGNEVYNAALMNLNGAHASGGWSGTVGSWYVNGTTPTAHVKYLQNKIHDTWGECLNLLFTDDVDVIGNELYDCYSGHVYLDHGADVRVLQNLMYNTKAALKGGGVGIDDESYGGYAETPEHDILIANNYFGKGLSRNLFRDELASWAASGNTWSHLHIVFNVFEANEFYWAAVGGGTAPSDGVIAGNIFMGSPSFSLGDKTAWTVSNNVFPAGVPSQFTGNDNFKATPSFVGPADGTSLAGFTITNAAALAVDYRAEVPNDALCATRTAPKTTAGLIGP